ncbi:MAG: hypothetical protein AAF078_05535, partial [Planctomycetota bacterium]
STNGHTLPGERQPSAVTRPSVDPDWWVRNWKKFCLTAALFTTFAMLSCFGGGFLGSTLSTKQTPQFQEAKALVEADPELARLTGAPLAESWIAWTNIITNDRGFAERIIVFSLTGPNAKVTVEAVATDDTPHNGIDDYRLHTVRVHLPKSAPPEMGDTVTLQP